MKKLARFEQGTRRRRRPQMTVHLQSVFTNLLDHGTFRKVAQDDARSAAVLHEDQLPPQIRIMLEEARRSRPGDRVTPLSLMTYDKGQEIGYLGLSSSEFYDLARTHSRLSARSLVVLSVTATETSADIVRTLEHVLVAHAVPSARHDPFTVVRGAAEAGV
jgi:hypothetical protein